ncbi:phosphatase PAP2 family protein [bacterium]|nr:phosphatase PAP2 family protein [bacterium]
MWETILLLDHHLFFMINHDLVNPVFDRIMPIISEPNWFILPIIILIYYCIKHYGRTGYILLVLTVLAIITSETATSRVFKPQLTRIRPCNQMGNVHLYVHDRWQWTPEHEIHAYKPARSYSCPSAHAANTFTLATLWTVFLGGWAWLFFLLAVAVSFSRVYLGVHFPLDVIAGALLGIYLGLFWNVLLRELATTWPWLKKSLGNPLEMG